MKVCHWSKSRAMYYRDIWQAIYDLSDDGMDSDTLFVLVLKKLEGKANPEQVKKLIDMVTV